MKIKIDDITYFVKIDQQDSDKETLVLLHGFMGSGAVFEHLIDSLKAFCNPVTVDLLGHGKTAPAAATDRFQAQKQADDLAAIIQEIDDEPVFLHGYSMGGRLALQLAQKTPASLKGLILESTNPGLKAPSKRKERQRLDSKRAQQIKTDFKQFLADWKELPLFKKSNTPETLLKRYQQIQQQQDPQQMAYSLHGFGTGQMPPIDLTEVKLPALLLAGEKDKKYVNIMKQMNDSLNKSNLATIPAAGHRIHLDQPSILSPKISSFIASHN